eukprot:TRINITY_DN35449_c0_g1_i1.p1 TRINITY_DN35449_c0_g1~~TRINITY_DN35449_c0_g1_i1.p1  ORF type:complete len:726 (+),score=116.06 TRINITY_DN35449_c0_g1_i1:219-2180(+)
MAKGACTVLAKQTYCDALRTGSITAPPPSCPAGPLLEPAGLRMVRRAVPDTAADPPGDLLSLAFFVLLRDEVAAAKRLLDILWRPRHTILLHVDAKAGQPIQETMEQLLLEQRQLGKKNVGLLQPSQRVTRGGWSELRVRLLALKELLKTPGWAFAVFLTVTHYPLRPVEYIERYLWLRNLSHVGVEPAWFHAEQSVQDAKVTQANGLRLAFECRNRARLVRIGGDVIRLPSPAHANFSFLTGSSHVTLRRDLAETAAALLPWAADEGASSAAASSAVYPPLADGSRAALHFAKIVVQPVEAFFQMLAVNSAHCWQSHLVSDLTTPPNTFGDEEVRSDGADFLIAAPRALAETDVPKLRALMMQPAAAHMLFTRKIPNTDIGHYLRDVLDESMAADRTTMMRRQLAASAWRSSAWPLAERLAALLAEQVDWAALNCSRSLPAAATLGGQLDLSVSTLAKIPDLTLGPWGSLLQGGQRLELRLQRTTSPASDCVQVAKWDIRERLAVPEGRDQALIAVRIGSNWTHLETTAPSRDAQIVSILPAKQEVVAAVYWAPRSPEELRSQVKLHATFVSPAGESFAAGSTLRDKPGVGFAMFLFRLAATQVKRAGEWQLRLTWDGDPFASIPFRVYRNVSRLPLAVAQAYFDIQRRLGH